MALLAAAWLLPLAGIVVGAGIVGLAASAAGEVWWRCCRRRREESRLSAAREDAFQMRLGEALEIDRAGVLARARASPGVSGPEVTLGRGQVFSGVQVDGESRPRILVDVPLVARATSVRLFAPPRLVELIARLFSSTSTANVVAAPDPLVLREAVPPETADLWIGPDGRACVRVDDECGGQWTLVDLG